MKRWWERHMRWEPIGHAETPTTRRPDVAELAECERAERAGQEILRAKLAAAEAKLDAAREAWMTRERTAMVYWAWVGRKAADDLDVALSGKEV